MTVMSIDEAMKAARTITPETEAEADEVYRHAKTKSVLPVGYIVRARVRCNQLNTFTMIACDWSDDLEGRHETIEGRCLARLRTHLRHAHPYLGAGEARRVVHATHTNLRDFGR